MTSVGGIELHYYLEDGKHSMDAILRNRCEAELLAIFHEVASTLGLSVQIDAQALAEGGLREIWKWAGENSGQLSVILSVVALLVSLAPQIYESEEEALSKELTELSIEEKRLQIEKLRQELREVEPRTENATRDNAVHLLKKEPKIVVRRSNFYKNLSGRDDLESIGISPLDQNLNPFAPERNVPKERFHHFILTSHSIKPLIIENANIEVVSPVLREGRYKWKGIYDEQVIGFTMQDSAFQHQVLREEVTFQHGTFLECVLNVFRKLDEVGEVEITGYVVTTVIRKYDERQSIETPQGKSYKHAQKLRASQSDLFGDGKQEI
ncbi:hypothetical protein J3362_01110 [Marinobacter sp. NFXS11]|uniref:hypothetical protein n=1 Tax=Marinobacter sp. NFXS11 TaxID=2818432 RepID=UPI0032DE3CB1